MGATPTVWLGPVAPSTEEIDAERRHLQCAIDVLDVGDAARLVPVGPEGRPKVWVDYDGRAYVVPTGPYVGSDEQSPRGWDPNARPFTPGASSSYEPPPQKRRASCDGEIVPPRSPRWCWLPGEERPQRMIPPPVSTHGGATPRPDGFCLIRFPQTARRLPENAAGVLNAGGALGGTIYRI